MLKWNEGSIWTTKDPIVTNAPFFQYKYIIHKDGKLVRWEDGVDRIADCEILPEMTTSSGRFYSHQTYPGPNVKMCELLDTWEKYQIKFSCFSPFDDNEVVMESHTPEIENLRMIKTPRDDHWLLNKYGVDIVPW